MYSNITADGLQRIMESSGANLHSDQVRYRVRDEVQRLLPHVGAASQRLCALHYAYVGHSRVCLRFSGESSYTLKQGFFRRLLWFQEEADPECHLKAVVMDMHSHVVLDKTLKPQAAVFPPIELNGLRPYHKYTVSTKVSIFRFLPVLHLKSPRPVEDCLLLWTIGMHPVVESASTAELLHNAGQTGTSSLVFWCVDGYVFAMFNPLCYVKCPL